jgi:AcrR family transcriptional regulator
VTNEQRPRRGRRPGQGDTRNVILEAAQRLFATEGYDHTTIRAVAEMAGVDSALVMHYFSSKDGLFRAATEWPFDIDEVTRHILDGDPSGMGERLVRVVCEVWEDETTRHPLTVILRNAVQREEAAALWCEFIERYMVARVVERTGDPTAAFRGSLAHAAVVGLILARYVIRVEPLASAAREDVVRAVGPTVQRYLAGDMDCCAEGEYA